VIGERVSLEEMGGARMHATVSGSCDILVSDDGEAIEEAKVFFSYLPGFWRERPPSYHGADVAAELDASVVPESESQPFDIHRLIDGLIDADSFFELKAEFAAEVVVGLGRIDGRPVGVVANNSAVRGGVLFNDSSDKAARFIWFCDAFNIPLLYLADVPGFMIGASVERQGIIRHGARLITAVAEATVPQISVIVRKAYGAGLYAMGGPGFSPDACLALPSAHIAVMGPDAAVNAVYAKKIAAIDDEGKRAAYVAAKRAEYEEDVDLMRLASDLVIDGIVEPSELRGELVRRFAALDGKQRVIPEKHHGVPPA
jgi:acetyl-CoA carboxylase carboxyltransferase component